MDYSIFDTSFRTTKYEKKAPVYRATSSLTDSKNTGLFWKKRVEYLQRAFNIDGETSDAGDRLLLQNDRQMLSFFKASDSFLYYDLKLASPADPGLGAGLLSEQNARDRAEEWLKINELYDSNLLQFAGYGYTVATVGDGSGKDPDPGVKTEIRVHHVFQLNGLPMFGPGAKVSNSFVGKQQTRVIHFWRTADALTDQKEPIQEIRILTPEAALKKRVLRDPRFAKLEIGKSKVRFHDMALGYYAISPNLVQRLYLPVYQLKGTLETANANGNDYFQKGEIVADGRFRYNFTYYILAMPDPSPALLKYSGLSEITGNEMIF